MTTSIVLLAGINLGRNKRVAMADLRAVLTAAGFDGVRTYVASGNVVLDAELTGSALATAVGQILADDLGLRTDVIVRSSVSLEQAIAADPFGVDAPNGSRHVLGFLSAPPDPERVAELERRIVALPADGDRHHFAAEHFYLWCPNGVSKSPYFKTPWKRLGVGVTQRNWNTVTALARLAAG